MRKILFIGFVVFATSMNTTKGQQQTFLEERLQAALGADSTDMQKKLKLVDYDYPSPIESVTDLQNTLDSIFADDAYMAVQEYTNFDFTLYKIRDIKESEKDMEYKRFDLDEKETELYNNLSLFVDGGMAIKTVKLKWLYNEKDTICSTAIVTDEEGIFYEAIGHLLIVPKKNHSNAKALSVDNLMNDSVGNSVKRFNRTFACYNVFGQSVCSYAIDCSSTFNADGILVDRNYRTRAKTAEGYTSFASFDYTAGKISESTFNEFTWKWAYTSGNWTLENRGYTETGSGVHGLK